MFLVGSWSLVLLAAGCRERTIDALGDRDGIDRIAGALASQPPAPLRVSPDGTLLLIKTFQESDFELTVIDRVSGRVHAVDRSANIHAAAAWRPDGRVIAYLADEGGNQRYRPYVLDIASGVSRAVGGPPTRVHDLRWAPLGDRFAYVVAGPDRTVQLWAINPDSGDQSRRLLADGLARSAGFAWSPDGGAIATVRATDSGAIIVARAGAPEMRRVVAPGGEVRELAWASDGRRLVVSVRSSNDEYFGIKEVDLHAGSTRQIAAGDAALSSPAYTPKGRDVLYAANIDGETQLYLTISRSRDVRRLEPAEGSVRLVGFSPGGDSVYIVQATRTGPPALYATSLGTGRAVRVTGGESHDGPAIAAERTNISAPDGLAFPAYLWRPTGDNALPRRAIVVVHGGPALQVTPAWDAGIQYLAASGYHVLQPNYRGSTGYGRSLDRAPTSAGQAADDVVAACLFATSRLGVAPGRVVVLGTSYGASLALRALAREPDVMGGVVLTSLAGPIPRRTRRSPAPPRLIAFHGVNDAVQPPSRARAAIGSVLDGDRTWTTFGRWHTVEGEGHIFRRIRTLAAVYAAAAMF